MESLSENNSVNVEGVKEVAKTVEAEAFPLGPVNKKAFELMRFAMNNGRAIMLTSSILLLSAFPGLASAQQGNLDIENETTIELVDKNGGFALFDSIEPTLGLEDGRLLYEVADFTNLGISTIDNGAIQIRSLKDGENYYSNGFGLIVQERDGKFTISKQLEGNSYMSIGTLNRGRLILYPEYADAVDMTSFVGYDLPNQEQEVSVEKSSESGDGFGTIEAAETDW